MFHCPFVYMFLFMYLGWYSSLLYSVTVCMALAWRAKKICHLFPLKVWLLRLNCQFIIHAVPFNHAKHAFTVWLSPGLIKSRHSGLHMYNYLNTKNPFESCSCLVCLWQHRQFLLPQEATIVSCRVFYSWPSNVKANIFCQHFKCQNCRTKLPKNQMPSKIWHLKMFWSLCV